MGLQDLQLWRVWTKAGTRARPHQECPFKPQFLQYWVHAEESIEEAGILPYPALHCSWHLQTQLMPVFHGLDAVQALIAAGMTTAAGSGPQTDIAHDGSEMVQQPRPKLHKMLATILSRLLSYQANAKQAAQYWAQPIAGELLDAAFKQQMLTKSNGSPDSPRGVCTVDDRRPTPSPWSVAQPGQPAPTSGLMPAIQQRGLWPRALAAACAAQPAWAWLLATEAAG